MMRQRAGSIINNGSVGAGRPLPAYLWEDKGVARHRGHY
jgi:hypothetical protein